MNNNYSLLDQNMNLDDEERQKRLEALQAQAQAQAPKTPDMPLNREEVLQKYKQDLMRKLATSGERLSEAEKKYQEESEGSSLQRGLSKGFGALADVLGGMSGGKIGYTRQAVQDIEKEKEAATKKYKSTMEQEAGLLKKLDEIDERQLKQFKIKSLKEASDPKSKESVEARAFVKKHLGLDLPESTNALQAKVFMEKIPSLKMQREQLGLQRERMGLERSKEMRKMTEAQQERLTKDAKYKTDLESKLRKELNADPETKEAIQVRNMYRNVEQAAKDPSAAGDLNLIFSYMKLLDPGSVVREGEFANAQNSAGVPDRVRNYYNRSLSGERLNVNQRKDFVEQARKIYAGRAANMSDRYKYYEDLAQRQGLDIKNIVYDPFEVDKLKKDTEIVSTSKQAESAIRSLDDNQLDDLYKKLGGK